MDPLITIVIAVLVFCAIAFFIYANLREARRARVAVRRD